MDRLTVVIFDHGAVEINPESVSILVQVTLLEVKRFDLAANQTLALTPVSVKIVRMGDVFESCGKQLLLGVTQQVTQRLRNFQPPAVQADVRQHHQRESFGARQPHFALSQSLLRLASVP